MGFKYLFLLSFLGFILVVTNVSVQAQESPSVEQLERRVQLLEQEQANTSNRLDVLSKNTPSLMLVALLFGGFCALWAQNTQRNAWLWFFMGALFSVITVLVLLSKNSRDRHQPR